ncbi:hypothetical protein V6N13_068664 [Hibiscus sabdariffa]|uniref:Uncharacterized protein n=1 Tax=Hibiscus sabdariffa TaxID=183260 RepID=A0ABR2QN97_9ROSI
MRWCFRFSKKIGIYYAFDAEFWVVHEGLTTTCALSHSRDIIKTDCKESDQSSASPRANQDSRIIGPSSDNPSEKATNGQSILHRSCLTGCVVDDAPISSSKQPNRSRDDPFSGVDTTMTEWHQPNLPIDDASFATVAKESILHVQRDCTATKGLVHKSYMFCSLIFLVSISSETPTGIN